MIQVELEAVLLHCLVCQCELAYSSLHPGASFQLIMLVLPVTCSIVVVHGKVSSRHTLLFDVI
eukprot:3527389-Prorocentrum_lima.AAC.1